jgi:uncharacterized membrane protein
LDIHPLVIHFPIALLIVGSLCDAVGILGHRDTFLKTGFILLGLGAFASVVAAVSGDAASEIAEKIPNITEDLEQHEDLSTLVAFLAVLLVLIRTHFTLKARFVGAVRATYLVLILLLAVLTAAAGYTGGKIVYDYGAGTRNVTSELIKVDSNSD